MAPVAPRKPTNMDERESISVVARRNGVAPNLLYRWRRLMLEGGSVAVTGGHLEKPVAVKLLA